MARYLKAHLEAQRYRAVIASDAAEARRLVDAEAPDALLLDGGLPGMERKVGTEGFALLLELRERAGCPVVVLARHGDPLACARALDLGAADWVARPFSTEELLARLRVVLRTHGEPPASREVIFQHGDLTIDFARRQVTVAGHVVPLSKTEYKLLRVLAQHPGIVLAHEALLERVWGPGYADAVAFLWVYIRRLRCKIEPDPAHPRYILTAPGLGYRLAHS
jgi:two-component system KDP operon response regulator KdpE